MTGWLIVASAMLGVLVGSAVTVAAARLPRGVGLRSVITADGVVLPNAWAEVPLLHLGSWARPRDGAVAVRPPVLELVTGGLFVLMSWRFGLSWTLPAYLTLAAAAALLSVVDLQHHRLPNVIVGPFVVAAIVLLAVGAIGQGAWEPLLRAILGGAILFSIYLALALISPASLGMGDVKLAGVLGLYLAYLSWRALILGGAGGFAIAALLGAVLLATRRVNRRTQLPFGPSMLAATLVAVSFSAVSAFG